jgi:hypothetical protein
MSEQEIIERGLMAEALMHDDNFNALYQLVEAQMAKEFLATALKQEEARQELFLTYHGMRSFLQLINGFRIAKDNIAEKRDAEHNDQQDID